MSNINFLKTEEDPKKEEFSNKNSGAEKNLENITWSKPGEGGVKKNEEKKEGFFGLFKKSQKSANASGDNFSNINISRKKVLQAIKDDNAQNSVGLTKKDNKKKTGSFLKKFFGEKRSKDGLFHYQNLFYKEKEQRKNHKKNIEEDKNQAEVKPEINLKKDMAEKIVSASKAPSRSSNEKQIDVLNETEKKQENKPQKLEEQAEEWRNPDVLDSNLIKGEVISFFDWKRKAFVFVGSILVPCLLVGIIYGGLDYYGQKQQAESEEINSKILDLEKKISQKQNETAEASPFQKRLKVAGALLDEHIYWNNFFGFLEEHVIDSVYFVNFSGDTGGEYGLEAVGQEYKNIIEQVEAFQKDNITQKAEVREGKIITSATGTGVNFNLELTVNPDIFKQDD